MQVISDVADFTQGNFFRALIDERQPQTIKDADKIQRVLLCSGKVPVCCSLCCSLCCSVCCSLCYSVCYSVCCSVRFVCGCARARCLYVAACVAACVAALFCACCCAWQR